MSKPPLGPSDVDFSVRSAIGGSRILWVTTQSATFAFECRSPERLQEKIAGVLSDLGLVESEEL